MSKNIKKNEKKQQVELTEQDWSRVFDLRCTSKSGRRKLDRDELRLCERALFTDPVRYRAMDKNVFNATKRIKRIT